MSLRSHRTWNHLNRTTSIRVPCEHSQNIERSHVSKVSTSQIFQLAKIVPCRVNVALVLTIERFSYDLEMKTHEQNRNDKRTDIERFDWFVQWLQTRMVFVHARELSRNQPILRFDVILQHDWPIEQCILHVRVFFGGKTKRLYFGLSIHWLIKQITNTYRNHFSRS